MVTEVCVSSLASAVNAERSGADRIELCSELLLGGVTPSYGLIKEVIGHLTIPVYVLIRPRSGSFTFSDEELRIMQQDIALCAELGCAGIVSGALSSDHSIDLNATASLIRAAGELDFTFHRAFDWAFDQEKAVEQLLQLGCFRVLSSGGCAKAIQGLENLKALHDKYGQEMTLMPGGGVNESNIRTFKKAGFREIHFSASRTQLQELPPPKISFFPETLPDERNKTLSDPEVIKSMVNLVK